MNEKIHDVTKLFLAAGWEEISLSADMERAGLDAVYTDDCATTGVVISSTITDVRRIWIPCQAEMAELKSNEKVGTSKDLYLVFIIKEIDPQKIGDLRDLTNDTYVCRKICLGQNGRSLEETLRDLPFLGSVLQAQPEPTEEAVEKEIGFAQKLPKKLESDLARRSASRVLDNWLRGRYRESKNDEN